MMDRDNTTRTGARTSGVAEYSASWWCIIEPAARLSTGSPMLATRCTKGEDKPDVERCMPGAGLNRGTLPGRSRPTSQPSSRTGENPPYGMIGGIEETSASFEARSAPPSYPTVADDARSREVRLCHSSWEAGEQSGPDRSGAGGAKGGDQGECEPAKHGPGTEPG